MGDVESGQRRTGSRHVAVVSRRSQRPSEQMTSYLSFRSPFPWNFPALTSPAPPVHSEPQALSPKPAAVGLLGEDLQMLGFC